MNCLLRSCKPKIEDFSLRKRDYDFARSECRRSLLSVRFRHSGSAAKRKVG